MKKFLSDYLNIIIYTIIGLTFMIASFYLMINYYHSQEIKAPIYVANNEIKYTSYQNTIQALDTSLSKYKRTDDKVKRNLYNKVSTCRNILKSEGTLYTLQTNQTLSSYDVYKLGEAFQANILNVCYATLLSYLNEKDIPTTYKNLGSLIQSNVNILSNQTMFALDEIKNNSSYYFNTNISSATIRNNLLSDYNIIASSYNEFAKMVLNLSEVLNEGGNDND